MRLSIPHSNSHCYTVREKVCTLLLLWVWLGPLSDLATDRVLRTSQLLSLDVESTDGEELAQG